MVRNVQAGGEKDETIGTGRGERMARSSLFASWADFFAIDTAVPQGRAPCGNQAGTCIVHYWGLSPTGGPDGSAV